MTRHSKPIASDKPKESPTKSYPKVSLDDIEETETSLWILEQLKRIQKLLVEHEADDEMLEAVEYLIEDNDRWICTEIEMGLGSNRAGKA
jgi:hypothetical protein